jgi:hypothetical protein
MAGAAFGGPSAPMMMAPMVVMVTTRVNETEAAGCCEILVFGCSPLPFGDRRRCALCAGPRPLEDHEETRFRLDPSFLSGTTRPS